VKGDHLHHQENRPVGDIVLAIVTVFVFVGLRALPGDPIRMLVTRDQLTTMTPERIEELRHEAGLDRNVAVQYLSWVGGFFQGDREGPSSTRPPSFHVTGARAEEIAPAVRSCAVMPSRDDTLRTGRDGSVVRTK
jgi:hypothetical protein